MHSDQYILRSRDGGVLTLTLNRPDVLNSCNRGMVNELRQAIVAAGQDDNVRAILLTGAGRAFCAGQDLSEAAPAGGSPAPELSEIVAGYNELILAMRGIAKPIVAAVNGVAAGAGANIALACDFVLAAETASFIQAFIKIGLIPDNGGTYFLPRLVGLPRATAMAMLGDRISAQQAKDWGMIFDCVPPGALMEEAGGVARRLSVQPTRALGLIKRAFNVTYDHDLAAQLAGEAQWQAEAGRTADYREGVRAFQEKRSPNFTGQ
jgi:2-(1,2-epoxy-1,2-dihydrophenyl)acetyl-CoA isomerase